MTRVRPGQPGRVGGPGQAVHLAVVRRGHFGELAGGHVEHLQAAVPGRDGQGLAVRRGGHARHPADRAGRHPPYSPATRRGAGGPVAALTGAALTGAALAGAALAVGAAAAVLAGRGQPGQRAVGRADLDRVLAFGVGHPGDQSGAAQHLRQPGADPGGHRQGTGRAVPVGQPVDRAADLDGAAPAGVVAAQAAQVGLGRDDPAGPARGRRAEDELEPPGLAVRVERVQQPQVARAVVDDPRPVGARVARVEAVMVGVPAQVAAVERAGVHVAGALVVGQERQPPAGHHRAGQLAAQRPEHPAERTVRAEPVGRRGHPQPARGPAPVALPCGRVPSQPVQQRDRAGPHRQVGQRPQRQAPGPGRAGRGGPAGRGPAVGVLAAVLGGGRDRVGPAVLAERLPGRRDGQHVAVRRPAGDPGIGVPPVREPPLVAAVGGGQVYLGLAVLGAVPGDQRAVGRDPGMTGRRLVGGDPPGPAALDGAEPDIVF